MWRKRIITLSIALAALLTVPTAARAQFFGGFGFNPWGWGGWGGGWGGWGWNRPYTFGGISPGWGYGGFGFNPYMNSGFGYNSMWIDPFYYSGPQFYSGFAAIGDVPRMRSSLYPALAIVPAADEVDNRAHIRVLLPAADAQVWLDGKLMTETGTERRFVTPVLDSKSTYTYRVRARWRGPNGMQEDTRTISFRAGANVFVDFTRPR
jgi:uncharacterized protein (TIGR03000 family)